MYYSFFSFLMLLVRVKNYLLQFITSKKYKNIPTISTKIMISYYPSLNILIYFANIITVIYKIVFSNENCIQNIYYLNNKLINLINSINLLLSKMYLCTTFNIPRKSLII